MNDYFLDANAHSKLNLSKEQLASIECEIGIMGNPMAPNKPGREASRLVEAARAKIAELLHAPSRENIIFTHSCSEANNWAIEVLGNHLGWEDNGSVVNISPYEHKSIDAALNILPIKPNLIELNPDGKIEFINSADYSIFIDVQNEAGIIADFNKIRQNTKKLFMSDMAQSPGKTYVNLKMARVDIATFAPHKFGGMSGVGFLYLKDFRHYIPMYDGAVYERDIPGSPNVYGIMAAAIALENSIKNMKENMERAIAFRNLLENRLTQMGFIIVGQNANRIPTTTLAKAPSNLGVSGGLDLLFELSEDNIYVGLGSACGSIIEQPLKCARALGDKTAMNTEFIRISHDGREYDDKDAGVVCDAIEKNMEKIKGERR